MTERSAPLVAALTLLELVRDAWPRIVRMGRDAIAECHAAGHPAWVEGVDGRVWRLDPDGTRHATVLRR